MSTETTTALADGAKAIRRDQAVRELLDVAAGIDRSAEGEKGDIVIACVIIAETLRERARMIEAGERGPA